LAEFGFHSGRDGSETFVFRPQPASVQMARCQQVDINQANAASHESMSLDEQENLVILDLVHRRKGVQQGHDFPPVRQIPAGQFPKDKRMHGNLVHFQERGEGAARHTKVVNPNGCVHEHHYAALRRGMRLAPGSEPPSAAKRRALWRETRASRPMRTNEVFSFTPVSRDARAKIPSSMLSVVFIHISMDDSDVFVKQPGSFLFRETAGLIMVRPGGLLEARRFKTKLMMGCFAFYSWGNPISGHGTSAGGQCFR
jgi:hypothetical protein